MFVDPTNDILGRVWQDCNWKAEIGFETSKGRESSNGSEIVVERIGQGGAEF
jgi:hypothetical protein